ncbi:hypothetical protein QJQ45_012748 [Haematococcus lacustris]|nr:hypothetical protein QJQ45_012748 [Haematococcus lacustris]
MTSTRAKPRGEVAELTAALQNLCTAGKRSDKELRSQKRDVFKKVISHLSIGMDMSSLFPSMTSCANLSPDDIVLKKMLYLYITHYAAQTPDLALLTINQLHKDCIDQDPTVRGLALRSLCSLRVNNYMEYVTSPVLAGLDDRHPYVRRTAVIGVLKIYHSDASVVMNTGADCVLYRNAAASGMVERLKQLLRSDSDPQVLANCLHVLPKMEPADKLLNKPLLYSLVNRMKDFNDWAQCLVLQLVSEYKPGSDQEVYEILNSLEDRLGSGNSAVVLALARAFLHLTINMSATHQQVLERIKDPLKSLIGRDDPAITYAVLAHVLLLVQRAPIIFESDYSAFYCRAHDPWYIKQLKMEILSHLASSANCYDIITELTEYTRDAVYPTMAREAVKAVGRIALAVPDAAGIIERLLGLLESHCEVVVCEALVQMKDLLRRYPDMAEVVVSQVMATASGRGEPLAPAGVSEPEAKAALIWIIGQFGQHIQDAPYLMEPLVEGFSGEEVAVRLALLTAGAQLFFRRPPEMQLLVAGLADSHQDVHDRALLYFRLLRTNVAEAERIINPAAAGRGRLQRGAEPGGRATRCSRR